MNKRVAAFIITMVMVASLMPQAAFALKADGLRVAGIQVKSEGAVTGSGISGAVTYRPADRTLTLNGAAITAFGDEGDEYSGIYNGTEPLTIHLIGKNSVSKADGGEWRNALYTAGLLTITAEPGASLTLTATGGTGGNYGISAHHGLTITGGDITAVGGNGGATPGSISYGIFVENGPLQISGGSVTAAAHDTDSSKYSKSLGIFCDVGNDGNNKIDGAGNITISNAIVSATGGAAETSGGIMSKYHMNINSDATVVAAGGNTIENENAITYNRTIPRTFGLGCGDMGSITIKDSTVIATGGSFSYNGNTGDVTKQVGRSCGIFCDNANGGMITFRNCVIVARAGMVDNQYNVAGNKRCAVFNNNNGNNQTKTAIQFEGVKVAGAVGYDNGGLELFQNAGITVMNDYAVNFDDNPPSVNQPTRTVIGISQNNTVRAAAGLVIMPSGWMVSTPNEYGESMSLSGGTAIVSMNANALTLQEDVEIQIAGHTLAAVSLYEGTENSAGIIAEGSFTISGGGEVIAVGGMTNGVSYGVKHSDTQDHATINVSTLTACGFNQAVNAAPVLNMDAEDYAVAAYPAGYEPSGIFDYPLMKILPVYPLKVSDVWVTGLNKANVLGDDTVRFDPHSTTLTLRGATVNGIYSQGLQLNLALTGTNTISKDSVIGHGIDVLDGNLTIQSSGTSTIATDAIGGIGVVVDGSLTINGSGSLTVEADGGDSTGVLVQSDGSYQFTINGGTFTASGLGMAVNKAPNLAGYAGKHVITAGTNADGSDAGSYDETQITTYKHVHIEPVAPPAIVTVYNDRNARNATAWLAGIGLSENDLLVTDRLYSGRDYDALLRLADAKDVLRVYNIRLQSGVSSTGKPMYLNFDLKAKYAGQAFTLVHMMNGNAFEYFYTTSNAKGITTFGPLYSLSPFMLVKGTLPARDIPKTGDSAAPELWLGVLLLMSVGLAASAALARRKRRG